MVIETCEPLEIISYLKLNNSAILAISLLFTTASLPINSYMLHLYLKEISKNLA